ncbi:hypothetical protein BRC83_04890 [Halobacteriales archaeon QS_1_68_17]|nr:MAG: hypothetical protein BRC83_04890 [Halobacteriales archaeon QS_1_68_17]
MAEDASLDDFLDAGDSPDDGEGDSPAESRDEADAGDSPGDDRDAGADDSPDDNDGGAGVEVGDGDSPGDTAGGSRDGDEQAAEPAVSTYRWTPGGGACGECGATVERRWRNGGNLVCADCKEW